MYKSYIHITNFYRKGYKTSKHSNKLHILHKKLQKKNNIKNRSQQKIGRFANLMQRIFKEKLSQNRDTDKLSDWVVKFVMMKD